jgi:hypothetical protein
MMKAGVVTGIFGWRNKVLLKRILKKRSCVVDQSKTRKKTIQRRLCGTAEVLGDNRAPNIEMFEDSVGVDTRELAYFVDLFKFPQD